MQAHRSGQLFPILMATWLTESSALADAPLPARDELRGSSPGGLAGVAAHRPFLGQIVVEGSVMPIRPPRTALAPAAPVTSAADWAITARFSRDRS
jgi:hypothetical protein